jgi:hypothetical protein
MPPEMAYQPPPTAPAVHVMDCWAVATTASAATRAIVSIRVNARFDILVTSSGLGGFGT